MQSESNVSDTTSNLIRFRGDVSVVQRDDHIVLYSSRRRSALRVDTILLTAVRQLESGVQRSEFSLGTQTPILGSSADEALLVSFIELLENKGFLKSYGDPACDDIVALRGRINIDPLTDRVLSAVKWLPRHGALVLLAVTTTFALSGVVLLIANPGDALLANWDVGVILVAALILLTTLIPIHELAHAIACRAAGVHTGGLGVLLRRFRLPSLYVDTTNLYAVESRSIRFSVPIAGPLVDVTMCGALAWLAYANAEIIWLNGLLSTTATLSLIVLFFNTNLLTASDGSHAVEALLNNELARRDALARNRVPARRSRRDAWLYRILCIVHLLAFGAASLLVFGRP